MVKRATTPVQAVGEEDGASSRPDSPRDSPQHTQRGSPRPKTAGIKKATIKLETTRLKSSQKIQKSRQKRTLCRQRESSDCHRHSNRPYQFICVNRACVQELCSLCLLEHKSHIEDVKPLQEAIAEHMQEVSGVEESSVQDRVLALQQSTFKTLDDFAQKMRQIIYDRINNFKEHLIMSDEAITTITENVVSFQSHFRNYDESNPSFASEESLGLVRACIKEQSNYLTNSYSIEEGVILEQFERLLDNNIRLVVDGHPLNTTHQDAPKYLHWFEWEKKELHLFDVIENTFHNIKMITSFKTASFSRSIMLPEGVILLLGGQNTTSGAKKDVFEFDVRQLRPELRAVNRAPMIYKKYDFCLCYHDGFVYVICGKDSETEVMGTCERYEVAKNKWSILAPVNHKRYAAGAAVMRETDKIYLFGGRVDGNSATVSEIEEYCIKQDKWKVIRLANPHIWTPVEVCGCVQMGAGRILVFGGSDVSVEDCSHSYSFTASDMRMVKTAPLKKPQVFVNPPFVNGNFVFVSGNNYYINARHIHKFDIKSGTWEILN